MQWNKKNIDMLRNWGYSEEDIKQIKTSGKYLKLTDITTARPKRLLQFQAKQILGEKEFISGMARAAFHFTAVRESEDGKTKVMFDCSAMFK